MKITKKLSFGVTVLAGLVFGFYIQNQIGTRDEVGKFFADLSVGTNYLIEVNYPKDLIINIGKGKVALNQKLPYCLLLDKKNNMGVVFDGSESLNMKAFDEQPKNFPCKPYVIVGQNYVAGRKDNGEIRGWQIPPEMEVEINQKMLIDGKDKYLPKLEKYGKRLYDWSPILLTLVFLPIVLLINIWYSLVLLIAVKVLNLGRHPETKNKYWITLFFGSVLSIIINTLSWQTYQWKTDFPFLGTILITIASLGYLKWREGQENYELKEEKRAVKPRKTTKKNKK